MGKDEKLTLSDKAELMMWERVQQAADARFSNAQNILERRNVSDADKAKAHYDLALHYRSQNPEKTLKHYKQAAKLGHAGACYELARIYLQGNSLWRVDKNLEKARYYADTSKLPNDGSYDTAYYKQEDFIEQLDSLCSVIEAVCRMK